MMQRTALEWTRKKPSTRQRDNSALASRGRDVGKRSNPGNCTRRQFEERKRSFPSNAPGDKNRIYVFPVCSALRVSSSVLIKDSRGSFWIIGSIAHPSPNGTSRVSEIARHSMYTPPPRSSNRQ